MVTETTNLVWLYLNEQTLLTAEAVLESIRSEEIIPGILESSRSQCVCLCYWRENGLAGRGWSPHRRSWLDWACTWPCCKESLWAVASSSKLRGLSLSRSGPSESSCWIATRRKRTRDVLPSRRLECLVGVDAQWIQLGTKRTCTSCRDGASASASYQVRL